MCLADMTDTTTYARVAQLVEHDLAKVGAAGSSPVSRSLLTKRASDGCPFLLNRVLPDQVVRVSTFRSGRCLTASTGRWLLRSAPVRAEQTSTGRLASPFHSGRCQRPPDAGNVSRFPSKPGYLKFSLRSSPRRADKFYLPLSNGIMIFR